MGDDTTGTGFDIFDCHHHVGDVTAFLGDYLTEDGRTADPAEIEVKRRAVFALSQLPSAEGVPLLIDLARNHRIPEVRRQAMFWLGQSKDPRAIDFFEQILRAK